MQVRAASSSLRVVSRTALAVIIRSAVIDPALTGLDSPSLKTTERPNLEMRTVTANSLHDGSHGDTSREALRAQLAALRRIAPARRLMLMDDLTRLVRSMTWEGLKRRHPGLPEADVGDGLVLAP